MVERHLRSGIGFAVSCSVSGLAASTVRRPKPRSTPLLIQSSILSNQLPAQSPLCGHEFHYLFLSLALIITYLPE
ncbi:hypothetical protein M441DRAFT_349748 [Trichoderma asperellum CBS 433.97]|uniref:Uncharacterized protein n=1 Tax=Trichoderma asperellum (strain ATCC 204424 / CBS 433.97 / NBRC 101777) TaxID=1042311 RepID=A0A2T3ZI53_TRIA4|nr:hypothetical protein M441DRAFT_349748 [Trichoderma asperellum CBS 433.97]PTB44476.1 hypothetical protein M441DRAFT_349748 [Trichoderma asperellum CBS 433.97]